MKTLLTFLALTLLAVAAQAEVVIYNQSVTATISGGGKVKTLTITGYVVLDMDGGLWVLNARTVPTVFGKRKEFTVIEAPDYNISYLSIGVLKESFVLTLNQGETAGGAMMKGTVSTITGVFTGTQYSKIPKTATLSGFSLFEDTVLQERKGSYTFNSSRTIAANKAGNDLTATVSALRSALASQGYSYVVNFDDFNP